MHTANCFSLAGKTVLVTGASSGIGRGIAVACAEMGAVVVAAGRNFERLQQTLALLAGEGHIVAVADLSDRAQTQAMVAALPKIDGVVHCAGIGDRVLCKLMTEADVDRMMTTNFKAPVLLQTEMLVQKRMNKGASIVFVASMAVDSPSVGNALYSASKGALVSYANCLALELAPRGIRVNCISPAMVCLTPENLTTISCQKKGQPSKSMPWGYAISTKQWNSVRQRI